MFHLLIHFFSFIYLSADGPEMEPRRVWLTSTTLANACDSVSLKSISVGCVEYGRVWCELTGLYGDDLCMILTSIGLA